MPFLISGDNYVYYCGQITPIQIMYQLLHFSISNAKSTRSQKVISQQQDRKKLVLCFKYFSGKKEAEATEYVGDRVK